MTVTTTRKKNICVAGVSLAGIVLAGAVFAAEPMPQGYTLAAAQVSAEGKCGEGKCGESQVKKQAKASEGKCGEGQCGDAIFNSIDTDKDARISLAEFLVAAPGKQAVFAKKDTNKDGYIDEMESYLSVKAAYNENGRELPTGLFSVKE
ncbi:MULTISPECIES: EF-hand domain-containing protein [unclassified Pseudomonas]|jgi:uncharacterized low-complexity protein|uniref:HvfA family oxazolone/thioamide-modified RiPP metallophore n=1 Tax=unclassified Pseudomonas TaxID=196821 RepID=UPI001032E41C|nr:MULTISPECIES: EF-hand domain-containing protein [unclassified Pseudomonas]